jgi:hypothetical protein
MWHKHWSALCEQHHMHQLTMRHAATVSHVVSFLACQILHSAPCHVHYQKAWSPAILPYLYAEYSTKSSNCCLGAAWRLVLRTPPSCIAVTCCLTTNCCHQGFPTWSHAYGDLHSGPCQT